MTPQQDQDLSTLGVLRPVLRGPNENAALAVREQLRGLILNGRLPPGTTLNQVELAPLLGLSRTPVREAIRMLQEEGLVEAEPQKRARIVGFDPAFLESVYAQRILMESLAIKLAAEARDGAAHRRLEDLLDEMHALREAKEPDEWQRVHREFHVALVSGAVGPHLETAMRRGMENSERYRFLYPVARSGDAGDVEHREIVDAFGAGDGELAGRALVSHLARTALVLIAELAPSYDPVALRGTLDRFES